MPNNGCPNNIEEEEEPKPQWPRHSSTVMLEGKAKGITRTRRLTDEDLEELKGCADLGFVFTYEEIPELLSTLPALELCYSMSQLLLPSAEAAVHAEQCAGVTRIASWNISSPGDDPEEVKARLRYWAQAVACTVKLCN